MAEPVVIPTDTPPDCSRCRFWMQMTWDPKAGPLRAVPPAACYVRVRGTTGLHRHICAACQRATEDEILARFVAPEEED